MIVFLSFSMPFIAFRWMALFNFQLAISQYSQEWEGQLILENAVSQL